MLHSHIINRTEGKNGTALLTWTHLFWDGPTIFYCVTYLQGFINKPDIRFCFDKPVTEGGFTFDSFIFHVRIWLLINAPLYMQFSCTGTALRMPACWWTNISLSVVTHHHVQIYFTSSHASSFSICAVFLGVYFYIIPLLDFSSVRVHSECTPFTGLSGNESRAKWIDTLLQSHLWVMWL